MDKQQLETTVAKVLDEMRERPIPLGISNRHIHLCAEDYGRLFPNHPISEKRAAAAVAICSRADCHAGGAKRSVKNVRLLGPLRNTSQSKFPVPTPARWELLLRCGCRAIFRAHPVFVLSAHLLNWT